MTTILLPRLDALSVDQRLEDIDRNAADAGRSLTQDRLPPNTRFAASGGSQVELRTLDALREAITSVARRHGFPAGGSTGSRAAFDAEAAALLARRDELQSAEADRDDVWAFIAAVLLPDVVLWRFGGRSAERFHGGVRNTFQRLWMRARALDLGDDAGEHRWSLLEVLSEDALVQLTERPALGADPLLCRAFGLAWQETARRIGRGKMEGVTRQAIIRIRIRNEIVMLSALEDEARDREFREIFRECSDSFGDPQVDIGSGSADLQGSAPGRFRSLVRTLTSRRAEDA